MPEMIIKKPRESTRPGFIWVKRPYNPAWKVELTPIGGGSDIDVTNSLLSFLFTQPVTYEIGRCEILLENSHELYNDSFNEGDTIKIYLDNNAGTAASASILKFKGTIEAPKKLFKDDRNTIMITGIHEAGDLLDIHVTASYPVGTTVDTILKGIIDSFAPSFTYTNVETSTSTTAINWSEKPFWDCVIDLCTSLSDSDCYVDNDRDFHFFKSGSKNRNDDAIVWDDNLRSNEGLGKDSVDIKNIVFVYGEDASGGIIIGYDSDVSTTLNKKELIINDKNSNTQSEVDKRATAELEQLKISQMKGTAISLLLPNVLPGDMMYISIKPNNILDRFKVINLQHKLEENGLVTTETQVSKTKMGIPQFFRDRMSKELQAEKIINPNRLYKTYHFSFDDDTNIDSHLGTETSNGFLQLKSGENAGIMKTNILNISNQATHGEVQLIGSQLGASIIKVSSNGGVKYDTFTKDTLKRFDVPGKQLKIKVELRTDSLNTNPQIDSLSFLFKW